MRKKPASKKTQPPKAQEEGITQITVCGFKSIGQEQSIEIRPLTILAGANSSGKSSIMQPLLLLKQTLEAPYDPGALLLDGPNVKFTSADQLFSRVSKGEPTDTFRISFKEKSGEIIINYHRHPIKGVDIRQMTYVINKGEFALRLGMTHDEIDALVSVISPDVRKLTEVFSRNVDTPKFEWSVIRRRCFLGIEMRIKGEKEGRPIGDFLSLSTPYISNLIHLPGLRGNPERSYLVTAVGETFPGTFEKYTASVVAQWQRERNEGKVEKLSNDLERLGLTWKIIAKPINDTQVELQVGRLTRVARGGARDLVNISDIGFGVSQILPVLVALHAAKPGQPVYLEQPELHLHPRAQYKLAEALADAANRGVCVIAETHSSLLLLGVQTLVAEGKLPPEKVKLHWFNRGKDGSTEVRPADLDEAGAFGDWPEDFADVALKAESRFLDAAWSRQVRN